MGCEADLSIVGAPCHTDYEQGRFVLAHVVVGNRKIVPSYFLQPVAMPEHVGKRSEGRSVN